MPIPRRGDIINDKLFAVRADIAMGEIEKNGLKEGMHWLTWWLGHEPSAEEYLEMVMELDHRVELRKAENHIRTLLQQWYADPIMKAAMEAILGDLNVKPERWAGW